MLKTTKQKIDDLKDPQHRDSYYLATWVAGEPNEIQPISVHSGNKLPQACVWSFQHRLKLLRLQARNRQLQQDLAHQQRTWLAMYVSDLSLKNTSYMRAMKAIVTTKTYPKKLQELRISSNVSVVSSFTSLFVALRSGLPKQAKHLQSCQTGAIMMAPSAAFPFFHTSLAKFAPDPGGARTNCTNPSLSEPPSISQSY